MYKVRYTALEILGEKFESQIDLPVRDDQSAIQLFKEGQFFEGKLIRIENGKEEIICQSQM